MMLSMVCAGPVCASSTHEARGASLTQHAAYRSVIRKYGIIMCGASCLRLLCKNSTCRLGADSLWTLSYISKVKSQQSFSFGHSTQRKDKA